MSGFEIIIGAVERDLFAVPSSYGHRTFLAVDGHHYTGVETYDRKFSCGDHLDEVVAAEIGEVVTTSTNDGPASYVNADLVEAAAYDLDDDGSSRAVDALNGAQTVVCEVCGRIILGEPADYVDAALAALVVCALWSTTNIGEGDDDDDGTFLDDGFGPDDLDASTLDELRGDLRSFIVDYWGDLAGLDAVQTGDNYWLSRNGHGAGFFDLGLGERGDRLQEGARIYGTVDLYLGDDGTIYA